MMRLLLLIALLLTGCAPSLQAQDPADEDKPPAGEITPDVIAAQNVELAVQLAHYGRINEVPEALVAAARILIENPTRRVAGEVETEGGEDAPPMGAPEAPPLDATALLNEAATLTDDVGLLAVIDGLRPAAARTRGATGGSINYANVIGPQATNTHTIVFNGESVARIAISGSGATDLDYYLYDAAGRLVGRDLSTHDRAAFQWHVPFTQRYRLVIRNLGAARNRYVIVTN